MLNNTEAPKLQDLANIPWLDTRESGVYGHLFTPLLDGHHNHFYIGEASGLKGLSGRQNEHKKEIGKGPESAGLKKIVSINIQSQTPHIHIWIPQNASLNQSFLPESQFIITFTSTIANSLTFY
ncbi:hypothetical protein EAE99_011139 [Botrytis elliptica]|nr:hypothetical protein EAE99_011139 [Botrytis elliptica]